MPSTASNINDFERITSNNEELSQEALVITCDVKVKACLRLK